MTIAGQDRLLETTMMEPGLTDLDLAGIDLDALFTHDARGRIVMVNEPDGAPAPRFIFVRTRVGNTWRLRYDVPDPIARELEAVAATEPVQDDLEAPPVHFKAMAEALGLARESGPPERDLSYRFPGKIPPLAGATRITRETIPLLGRMGWDLADVERGFDRGEPTMAMVVDGFAVSVCYSSRLTGRAAEAGLETHRDYRGRGYAPVVVAAWARAVRDSGRIPFYSTSGDNAASRAVARKLGLVQFGVSIAIE